MSPNLPESEVLRYNLKLGEVSERLMVPLSKSVSGITTKSF